MGRHARALSRRGVARRRRRSAAHATVYHRPSWRPVLSLLFYLCSCTLSRATNAARADVRSARDIRLNFFGRLERVTVVIEFCLDSAFLVFVFSEEEQRSCGFGALVFVFATWLYVTRQQNCSRREVTAKHRVVVIR